MVRTEECKLILYPRARQTQPCRMKEDPWETRNLASEPERGDIVTELTATLRDTRVEPGDPREMPGSDR